MKTILKKIGESISPIKLFIVAESVGIIGLISLFLGVWLQFGVGVALIVNGVLFVGTAVVSALRG
jgi:hypothetical protein